MNTGIPLEIMYGEGRVALVPAACAELSAAGHKVYLETGAGVGSGYSDQPLWSPDGRSILGGCDQMISVVDVTDPSTPAEVGFLETAESTYDVAVAGDVIR